MGLFNKPQNVKSVIIYTIEQAKDLDDIIIYNELHSGKFNFCCILAEYHLKTVREASRKENFSVTEIIVSPKYKILMDLNTKEVTCTKI